MRSSSLRTTLWSSARVGSLVRTSRAIDVLMTFAHSAQHAIDAPNVAAGERLYLNLSLEQNAQKFNIARLRG
jgi:hypothetical protein